jgi:hypothetical protein
MSQKMTEAELGAVLSELAVSSERPTAAHVEELARRHPEARDALRALAVDLALDAARGDLTEMNEEPEAVASPLVAKAMHRFRTAIGQEAKSPFAALDRASFRSLASSLHASSAFLMKVRDRVIAAGTMPEGFQRRLATELRVSFEELAGYLAGPPVLAAGTHYKADERPTASATQSFEEAVKSSGLTPEQQAYLLGL